MKITTSETRRAHSTISYADGERAEYLTWGDVKTVHVTLEEGEAPDMESEGYRERGNLFRPKSVELVWQRNTHRQIQGGSGWSWVVGIGAERAKPAEEGWVLTDARIRGTRVLVSGALGKKPEVALYANDAGYGLSHEATPPHWYVELRDSHDPNLIGSPLDAEPVPTITTAVAQ